MTKVVLPGAAVLNHALNTAVKAAQQGPIWGGNPQVGAVLVGQSGKILAVGYHRGAGSPHAEVDCLSQLPPDVDLSRTVLVLTLEPCNHSGKTPPCVEAIIDAGVGAVIYAVADPDPIASGGAKTLEKAGIKTVSAAIAGVEKQYLEAAINLSHKWVSAVHRQRPWVIAKIAQTADGYVAATDGSSQWITGELARAHAHRIRATQDVILVGTGTVLADNPQLTARTSDGVLLPHQPRKIIIGERPLDPEKWQIFNDIRTVQSMDRNLEKLLSEIFRNGEKMVLIEGGPTLVSAALAANLVDELHIYQAPKLLGAGRKSIFNLGIESLAKAIEATGVQYLPLGRDILTILKLAKEEGKK